MTSASAAWYREPWPWLLMVMPATALVAGGVTLWLAITSNNALVVDDYYREGKAINRTLARDQAARSHGVRAALVVADDVATVRLTIADSLPLPGALTVRLMHPTRSELDRTWRLEPAGGGLYMLRDPGPALADVRWQIQIEPEQGDWRLVGAGSQFGQPVTIGDQP